MTTPRPISEYHEDMGAVLWWKFPITELPYVGTPDDLGKEVMIETTAYTTTRDSPSKAIGPYQGRHWQRLNVGGWPGYHTHFTLIDTPDAPRRRTGNRMHPGWACFMQGWGSGLMTALAMVHFVLHADWGVVFYCLPALTLFWFGGKRAEGLDDRLGSGARCNGDG